MGKAVIESQVGAVTMIVDTMSDALETAYEARPFRLYVLNAEDGKIVYAPPICPFNMPTKCKLLKQFLSSNGFA